MILIVSVDKDVHALVIQDRIQRLGYTDCHIIASDQITGRAGLSFRVGPYPDHVHLPTRNGTTVQISDGVIWFRRFSFRQESANSDHTATDIIDNDCRASLTALLDIGFRGKWVSHPTATTRASNKIYQLSVAAASGFRVPKTLISQSKMDILNFYEEQSQRIIVKTVLGTDRAFLQTRLLSDPHLIDTASFSACPAIYQEFIAGTRHIRLNCFGNRSYAAIIESADLDWRPNLNVPVTEWPVPQWLHDQVRRALDALGLEMGVVDLKETPQGEIVWFEVNPQGQFLFLDPITNLGLANAFANYLLETVRNL